MKVATVYTLLWQLSCFFFFCIEPNVLALVKVKESTPPKTEEEVITNVQQTIEKTTGIQKVLASHRQSLMVGLIIRNIRSVIQVS